MTKKKLLDLYTAQQYGELIKALREEAPQVDAPSTVLKLLQPYARAEVECFLLITLDGAHRPIAVRGITRGLINHTLVHPREVFRPAILDNAVAIIIAHNHPSGNLKPSPDDDDVTKRLVDAGKIIGIVVLDHIIISPDNGYFSYTEHGRLPV